jgi:hypothetical protein
MRDDMAVVAFRIDTRRETAYPLLLLQKVEVVNDEVGGRPVVVVCTPFTRRQESVEIFDPKVRGERLTFGLSGLFQAPGPRPVLYDQQSESLWVVREGALNCIAGTHKGARLPHLAVGKPMPWADWLASNPEGRLIVGAFRDPTMPSITAR